MTEERTPHSMRILVGAGSFADAAAALRLVERLPSRFRKGLGGVLVEEVATLATCQMPHQRIVMLSGATIIPPGLDQLRTLMKADARAFRKSLARAAFPVGADCVLAQDKGELVGTALRAAASWDILVIGYRQVHKIPGKIVVLEMVDQSSQTMKDVSEALSHQLSTNRVVFSVGSRAEDKVDPPSAGEVRFARFEDALAALTRTHAQAVLIDLSDGPVRTRGDLARLVEAARCPVLVFGTSAADARLEHSTQIPPAAARDQGGAPP
ncbi:hypothetical protein [uncultured Sulfitobacter sp.]|uniref:hypothetical protein n=1 Tax=uncultured Sulfitobacter sp. TaxID=191468 RepID=UPI0026335DE8|nr:hypothetical protein [uncultured Sulfitobacter sp.]